MSEAAATAELTGIGASQSRIEHMHVLPDCRVWDSGFKIGVSGSFGMNLLVSKAT